MLEIRTLERPDIPEVVEGWNRSLVYDRVTQERFEKVILNDPNYEKEGNNIGIYQGKIVGFVSAVAREGVAGKDGRGQLDEKDHGYIKGLFVLDDYWDTGVGEKLLDQAAEYLRSKNKSLINVVVYTGRYFFPGIDMRYERLLDLLAGNGYERLLDWGEICTIDDLVVNLTDFEPTEYHNKARKRLSRMGVKITTYRPEMLEKMREYVEKLDMGHWFPAGWEQGFGESGHTVVALKDQEIIGWANYWPEPQGGGFGPIGVLEAFRGNGIGSCLLLESMLRMKKLGIPKATAGWAVTDFYLKSGWKICRQYAPFQKQLQLQG